MKGIYILDTTSKLLFHHFTTKHVHRYLAEFEMRWNMIKLDETERLDSMLGSVSGLRLTYSKLKK